MQIIFNQSTSMVGSGQMVSPCKNIQTKWQKSWWSWQMTNFLLIKKEFDIALLNPYVGNKRIPPTNIPSRLTFWSRTGEAKKPQPDNYSGLTAGKLGKSIQSPTAWSMTFTWPMCLDEVKDTSGLTVEGLQEFYDEACLAVLNNKYSDGIQWHDVPCYFRSRIICEDSDLQMERVLSQHGVDVTIPLRDKPKQWLENCQFLLSIYRFNPLLLLP